MEQKAPEYGLEYSRRPPFTFIRTRWLDYPQLLQLKEMESVVKDYYNSGLFGNQIEWMLSQEVSPFSFFLDFGAWKVEHQLHLISAGNCRALYHPWDYYFSRYPERAEQEGAAARPVPVRPVPAHQAAKAARTGRHSGKPTLPRSNSRAVFVTKHSYAACSVKKTSFGAGSLAHLQVFSFDPQTVQPRLCAMLFDYHRRDLLGRAKVTDVSDLIL